MSAKSELQILLRAKDDASATMKNIGTSVGGMSRQFKMAGIAAVAMGAAIAAALVMTVKSFAEEEKGIIRLSTAMRNVGLDYEANVKAIEANINALQQKTGVADSEQRDSLASLVRITRDTTEAFDLLELAMDVGIGTGRDLESATTLLMYALSGNWGMLERYIPAIKEAKTEEEKWLLLRKLFAGQAEEYGKSLAGQFDVLKANIGDITEAIGGVLAPVVKDIAEKVVDLTEWIKSLNPKVVEMGTKAAAAAAGILTLVGGMTLLFVYVPKVTLAMKAMAVWMTKSLIPALGRLIATTWAHVAALVAQLAMMGPVGWALLAAGVAIAAGAIYGLVKGTQALLDTLFEADDALAGTKAAVEASGYSVWKLGEEEEGLADQTKDTSEALDTQEQILQQQIAALREAGYEVEKLKAAEDDLDDSVDNVNTSLSKQQIASLRAAQAKGKLAEAAAKLEMTEEEAQIAIQKANEEMTNQEVAAYAAADKKKTLEEIADELGMSERKLTRILGEANAELERQSGISAPSGAGWSMGATIAPISLFGMGGIVTKPTIGLLGEAGPEAIIPFGRGRAGGTVNHYHINIKTDVLVGNEMGMRKLARNVADYIRQDQRRKGMVTV